MAPPVQALAQSESKARFLHRLGLDGGTEEHKQMYHMMKVWLESGGNGGVFVQATDDFPRKRPSLGETGC